MTSSDLIQQEPLLTPVSRFFVVTAGIKFCMVFVKRFSKLQFMVV